MILRYAAGSDDLRPLWSECFPDMGDWAALFMRERYSPARVLIAEEDGRAAAMLHFDSMAMSYHGKSVPVTYMFGLGTHPDFRGRGIAKELVREVCRESARCGVPFVAVTPRSDELRGFYRKLGFGSAFFISRDEYRRGDVKNAGETAEPVTPDGAFKANAVYEKVLAHRDHMQRDASYWRFATLAAEITGGRMLGIRRDGEFCGYAVYRKRDNGVTVKEVFADDELAYDSLRLAVLEDSGAESAVIESPACAHSASPSAMLRAADPAKVLETAAGYRPFEGEIELEDELMPENSARYAVKNSGTDRMERSGKAFITPAQLVETVMSAGPAPYANLLFN